MWATVCQDRSAESTCKKASPGRGGAKCSCGRHRGPAKQQISCSLFYSPLFSVLVSILFLFLANSGFSFFLAFSPPQESSSIYEDDPLPFFSLPATVPFSFCYPICCSLLQYHFSILSLIPFSPGPFPPLSSLCSTEYTFSIVVVPVTQCYQMGFNKMLVIRKNVW